MCKRLVYSQTDIQQVMDFINSLSFQGIVAARQISTVATILEAGKPLEDYTRQKEGSVDGEALHTENMEK